MTEPVQLQIGVEWGMQLQLRFSGFAESYKTTLVGMERGRYLICSAPSLPGLWTVLNALDQTTVRYLHDGVVYGFKCTLLTTLAKPFQLLVLSYPDKIETVNLRQHQRVPCLIPAKAKTDQTDWDGALLDLSLSGCCFVWDMPREAQAAVTSGDEMEISYRMPGSPGEQVAKLKVTSVRKYGSRVTVGGSFVGLGGVASEEIRTYLETAQKLLF
jgi:c-di-GMP-binding flagellar brake protein YcgR